MFRKATKGRNQFMVVSFSNDEIYLDSQFKPIVL